MANQFNVDNTNYDIGSPLISIKVPFGSIAHTPRGIVVSTDSGTRYTCSYNRLLSLLKVNVYDPKNVEVRDNINDILDDFKKRSEAVSKKAELRMNELEKMFIQLKEK